VVLGTEVKPEAAADNGRLTHLKGIKGVLYITTKLRETKTYTVKNRNPQDRLVLIGHPVRDQFQLVDTTMLVQTARNAYRFEPKVPAGRPGPAAAGVGLGVRPAAPDQATRPSPPCAHGASRGPISAAEPRRSVGCDRRRPRRGGPGGVMEENRCNRSFGWVASVAGIADVAPGDVHLGKVGSASEGRQPPVCFARRTRQGASAGLKGGVPA
jgi:hypothetical protein